MIERDAGLARTWAGLGAHVARGEPTDADLVERAAQHVRSVVVMERAGSDLRAVIEAGCEGAALASNRIRMIVCASSIDTATVEIVTRSRLEHVILLAGRSAGGLFRRRIPADRLAEAIDAADDLSGHPRLQLDLGRSESWSALGLDPPR